MKNSTDTTGAFEKYPPALQEIIATAERGRDADWKLVDKRLPEIMKRHSGAEVAIGWARKKGLTNKESENIRDLAASMFVLYEDHLTGDDYKALHKVMQFDAKKPAGFRAACALFKHSKHDDEKKREEVMHVLERFSKDKDPIISKHAQKLLAQEKKEEQK
ncbi:hypothetical protein A2673_02250 [Candidatus Kaiserbacteria bacterium RIFCSPHIGHO2_01_FULL_50_13]|uniref:HEAT repeat domain-containing protein n=1 Tax=Candidatus Kaiserbacteria bacterium RIFCSPLOWO2_01_FULL_50_24 TaxID=1798507 RepID=A0A1F6ER52_9BACT|nr:MAG: hypothetical protein A2673_02250 [Candidatus Kaiserbacteria bacterium RIFCSPHIGHO2_01_FULL_50_13]OGG76095.1 MAG: hypothetical protein A3A34_00715 [Candidatus Kaiserbacteria bacterium RIFCSPLOWO2_01_FULL_50_24]OGG82373.1 MAG: hypothetical protein A3H74_00200 [Candidatus Kaiserbacteria bacterium RIFCSPLOWO2_02_FULL_51_13]